MAQRLYDPDNWLVSLTRALEDYVTNAFLPATHDVQMSYPDVLTLGKSTPLSKVLVHIERDDLPEGGAWALGTPGVDVFGPDAPLPQSYILHEAQREQVTFDLGVWASAQAGGETIRMKTVQTLTNLFGPAKARLALKDATGGIKVVSFSGGRDATDRINDLPVWRTMDMTLAVEVFSRHIPVDFEVAPETYEQNQQLVIDTNQAV